MLECTFCHSPSKEQYIATQCSHLACLECVGIRWDRKFSLRCCNQITYLNQEAVNALNRDYRKVQFWENKENMIKSQCQNFKINDQAVLQRVSEPPANMFMEISDQRKENNLYVMQKVLNEEVAKLKQASENCRKEIDRRQQNLLKELYNTYSEHLTNLPPSFDHQQVEILKEKLEKVSQNEPKSHVPVSARNYEQFVRDKILDKLDYNQQMMKEKLHKHYDLLK